MGAKILVPFELPDPEPLSPVLVEDLSSLDIVVLGHYGLPEQTPPTAARSQFEEGARETLEGLAADFEEAGAQVTTRLVFGRDRRKTMDRIAIEEDCDAELDPAPTDGIERILVPLPNVTGLSRLPEFVRVLCEESTREVTLFHVAEAGERVADGEEMLRAAREEMLREGFDPAEIDTLIVEGDEHDDEILRMAEEYDAVVMYQAEPALSDRILGTLPDAIATRTGDPVIVVRRDY